MAQFPPSFGTAFATAGFASFPEFSPNNQQFTAAVLATVARVGLPFGFEPANVVLAGPAAGAAALPTYRALVAADVPGGINGFANPTGLIGLSAVNGTATTAERSDSTHALDQSIAPTWTGNHTWGNSTAAQLTFNCTAANGGYLIFQRSGSSLYYIGNAKQLLFAPAALDDFAIATNNALCFGNASSGRLYARWLAGSAVFGNTTDNPTYAFTGTGLTTFGAGVQATGPVAAALVDMTPDQGTFTGTITGCTTSPTGTCRWVRVGQLVMLFIPIITGTSNATTFTMTGLPAAIQPARTMMFPVGDLENASVFTGTFAGQVAAASGTLTLFFNGSSSGFTNTGTKGFSSEQVVCWTLN